MTTVREQIDPEAKFQEAFQHLKSIPHLDEATLRSFWMTAFTWGTAAGIHECNERMRAVVRSASLSLVPKTD